MKKLIKNFLDAFWNDELAARRWLRGLMAAAVPIGVQLLADGTWATWTLKTWVVRAIPSIFAFAHGAMQSSAKKAEGDGAPSP